MKRFTLLRHLPHLAAASMALAGCGGSDSNDSYAGAATVHVAQSTSPRDPGTNVPAADTAALVAANTQFAFDLHRIVASYSAENVVASPYALSLAFAMLEPGANANPTAGEIDATLHFPSSGSTLVAAMNALDLDVERRANGQMGTFTLATSLWMTTQGVTVVPGFLDSMATYFGQGIHQVDFFDDANGSRIAINEWVAQTTGEGATPFLASDVGEVGALPTVATDTQLLVVSAPRLSAAFATPFTGPTKLAFASGGNVVVDGITARASLGYAYVNGVQALELPYAGGQLSMVILMPDPSFAGTFDSTLDAPTFASFVQALRPLDMVLTLPTFDLSKLPAASLTGALSELGMTAAFGGGSNYSGVATPLAQLTDVEQQAVITVDAPGASASGPTPSSSGSDGGAGSTQPTGPTPITLNQPFSFFVRDTTTGSILFTGHLAVPPT